MKYIALRDNFSYNYFIKSQKTYFLPFNEIDTSDTDAKQKNK